MEITLIIGCVDGSTIQFNATDREAARRFLKSQDHEGSSVLLEVTVHGGDVYNLLEAPQQIVTLMGALKNLLDGIGIYNDRQPAARIEGTVVDAAQTALRDVMARYQ